MNRSFTEESKHELIEPDAIRRAQHGDAAAFEYLYNSHSRHVYSVCLRMLKNTADAEDLTQQIFLRLFRKIATFRGDSGFSTWLHRVTVNAVLMHLRRRKPTTIHVDTDGDDTRELGPGDTSIRGAVDRMSLIRAIRQLPASDKQCFLLHYLVGFKHSEIAKLVKCTVGCSKSRAHRARKHLRHLLLDDEGQAIAPRRTAPRRTRTDKLPELHIARPSFELGQN